LKQEALDAIRDHIQPGMKLIRQVLIDEYLPKTRKSIAVTSLPNGENFYKKCIKFHTSTNLTPKEIHEIGLKEVDHIETEMKKVMMKLLVVVVIRWFSLKLYTMSPSTVSFTLLISHVLSTQESRPLNIETHAVFCNLEY